MLSLGAGRKKSGWLAVVPLRDRIDLAHVVRQPGRRPEITLLESFRHESLLAEDLGRLRAAKKLARFRCTTLLAPGQYHLAPFEAPPVPAEERADALRWQFKDLVDFPVEGASIGVIDIPVEGGGARKPTVFAAAASAATVASVMADFARARLSLAAIDLPELAQRNVAALFETENRGLAFLHLDEGGGLLTITYRGELYAVRRMEVGTTQLLEAAAERRAQLMERMMLELQRTLDNFDRQFSFISITEVLVAVSPEVEELVPYLAQNLYLPVKGMDLAAVCDFPAVPELKDPSRQAQCLPAIGAALRSAEG